MSIEELQIELKSKNDEIKQSEEKYQYILEK